MAAQSVDVGCCLPYPMTGRWARGRGAAVRRGTLSHDSPSAPSGSRSAPRLRSWVWTASAALAAIWDRSSVSQTHGERPRSILEGGLNTTHAIFVARHAACVVAEPYHGKGVPGTDWQPCRAPSHPTNTSHAPPGVVHVGRCKLGSAGCEVAGIARPLVVQPHHVLTLWCAEGVGVGGGGRGSANWFRGQARAPQSP